MIQVIHYCPVCGRKVTAPVQARITCNNPEKHSECEMIVSDQSPVFKTEASNAARL